MLKRLIRTADDSIMSALLWATSTKGAFYALNVLIFIAVIISPPMNIQGWLLVVVSEYYQGVALPGLGAAQKKTEASTRIQNELTRKLLQETHDAVMAELADVKAMHEDQTKELAELRSAHNEITALVRSMSEDRQHIVQYLEALANPQVNL